MVFGVAVLLGVAVLGAVQLSRVGAAADQIRWDLFLAAAATLVGICFAYAFLGARIGRVKANKVMSVAVALALVGFIYWLTRHLDSER
jgi:hypothetical protein